jgi:uncharacterized protein YkwD
MNEAATPQTPQQSTPNPTTMRTTEHSHKISIHPNHYAQITAINHIRQSSGLDPLSWSEILAQSIEHYRTSTLDHAQSIGLNIDTIIEQSSNQ